MVSVITEQKDVILSKLKKLTADRSKVLVLDETSKKIVYNVTNLDAIIDCNIMNVSQLEERRQKHPVEAIYLLSPKAHVARLLEYDIKANRYASANLVWLGLFTGNQDPFRNHAPGQMLVKTFETLTLEFYPRESQVIVFRDPWSFPTLFHPACNELVARHLRDLSQKIVASCVSLGEAPKIRYYKPPYPVHEAHILSAQLAKFVHEDLDQYCRFHPDFPPPSSRPQSVLLITDRSMDLMAPLVHEFTYQAMAHDVLPIQDGDKVTYRPLNSPPPRPGEPETPPFEFNENDSVWVNFRHLHMKDTTTKMVAEFKKFIDDNPHFTKAEQAGTIDTLREMMAGLEDFKKMKQAFSTHIQVAQECMDNLQQQRLMELANLEQSLAIGLDETGRKPKEILQAIVVLLADQSISAPNRLRLILLYILYRDGLILPDVDRLLAHASLPPRERQLVLNLALIGAHSTHELKSKRQTPPPLFPRPTVVDESAIPTSRFKPELHTALDHLCQGKLDPAVFPSTNPQADLDPGIHHQGSLRASRPNWASSGRRGQENRQRVFCFVAGGATYSEARSCYEVSRARGADVILITSHMVTPSLFLRQVSDLDKDVRSLDLPLTRPPPPIPSHFEEERRAPPPQPHSQPQYATPNPGRPGYAASPGPHGSPHNPYPHAQAQAHAHAHAQTTPNLVAQPGHHLGNSSPSPSPGPGRVSMDASPSSGKKEKSHHKLKVRNILGMKK